MERFVITEINGRDLVLEDKEGNSYSTAFSFVGVEVHLHVGASVYMHKQLLLGYYENYNWIYDLGDINSPYGCDNVDDNHEDAVTIKTRKGEFKLKRVYG